MTPAHKLIQDNNNRRKQRQIQQQQHQQQQLPIRKPALKPIERLKMNEGGEEVQSQLATICSSLLRNEQTLLQMLQNQMSGSVRREGNLKYFLFD